MKIFLRTFKFMSKIDELFKPERSIKVVYDITEIIVQLVEEKNKFVQK